MKLIPLTQGKFAQVDDADYGWLTQWKWFAVKCKNTYYAERWDKTVDGVRKHIPMHRQILGVLEGMDTDHRDGDGLNNQRFNIRSCTTSQNCRNRKTWGNSSYIGVSRHNGKYQAAITINGVYKYIGIFTDEEEAARARDRVSKEHFGEFAKLNFT